MAVSKLLPAGGANDFNVSIAGSSTTVTFTKEYSSGGYSIVSSNNDTTLDIYIFNADGSLAGYSGTKSLTATKGFSKMVILGGTTGDLLSFSYKATFVSTASDNEVTAGPFITSASTSALPSSASTTTITGGNFASGVTATFTSTVSGATFTPTIVRNSSTSVTITRDNLGTMVTTLAPFTLTLENPGVSNPIGSNVNKLTGFTVGTAPVWSTSASLPNYARTVAYSQTLVASDTEGSTITYALQSGTLPDGITLASNGVLSGTATVLTNHSPVIRATDTGGNFVDRTFTLNNVGANAPVWSTPAGALAAATTGVAYSVQLSVSDDSGTFPTLVRTGAALPAGLTLSSTGLISGTPTDGNGNQSFTITATDQNGSSTARSFTIATTINRLYTSSTSITLAASTSVTYLVGGGGGSGGSFTDNVGCGGGGAGGGVSGTTTIAAGTYSLIIGAGAPTNTSYGTNGSAGNNSSVFGLTGNGGGYGGTNTEAGGSGGCGGGGARRAGGTGSQGGNGGSGLSLNDQYIGSGGGGMGGAGRDLGQGGDPWTRLGYTVSGGGAGGRGTAASPPGFGSIGGGGGASGGAGTANTGGGGGGSFNITGGAGGSGYVVLQYLG